MQDIDDRIAERIKEQRGQRPPLIPGTRTTEFWVVLAALLPWAADKFGLDAAMLRGAVDEAAKIVDTDGGSDLTILIAAVYVIGRIMLKYFRG
jgi:hypothetical protein